MKSLIIGGTGMLKAATQHFLDQNHQLAILARNPMIFDERTLSNKANQLRLISINYAQTDNFIGAIQIVQKEWQGFDRAIIWMHNHAQASLVALLELLNQQSQRTCDIYHLQGSAAYRPNRLDNSAIDAHISKENYHQVILGFQIEDNCSRWLTHQEISQGTIYAVENKIKRHIIGTIEPWEKHP